MRLVDYFIDVIVVVRQLDGKLDASGIEFETLREKLVELLTDSREMAEKNNFSVDIVNAALFPVVAYIDELILCSSWSLKSRWQKESLQRKFFTTTNIGAEFYTKLNELSKHGPDEGIREVYVLCLGLGFKGKYFSNDDRQALENVKAFNLGLLLPEEAQRNLDTATLFPTAYSGHSRDSVGRFKSRLNVIPYVVGIPLAMSLGLVAYYHLNIAHVMDQIINSVR